MKTYVYILAVLCLFTVAQGEDLVTKSGKVFHDYKIDGANEHGVKVIHRKGLSWVLLSDLPDDIRYANSPNVLKTLSGKIYEDYSVIKVSRSKIKISYRGGEIWISHKELPQKLLEKYSSEIQRQKEIYAQKQRKKQTELAVAQVEQTEELKQFLSNLQKMSWKELQLWSKKRVGIYLYQKEFEKKFLSVFSEAKDKHTVLKELKSRRTAQFNKSLMKLADKLSEVSPELIDSKSQNLLGFKYSDRNFREKLEKIFYFADKFDGFMERINSHIRCAQENELKNIKHLSVEKLYSWLEVQRIDYYNLEKIKEKFDRASNADETIALIKQKIPELVNLKEKYLIREREEREKREKKEREVRAERERRYMAAQMETDRKNAEKAERLRQMQFRKCNSCYGIGVVNNVVIDGRHRSWHACPACNGRGGTGGRQLFRSVR